MINIIRTICNFYLDIRIGGKFLGGSIKSKYSNKGAKNTSNSQYAALEIIFKTLRIQEEDILVDVGCGKGRVINFWIMKYPQNKIYGLELDADVAAWTKNRLRRYSNVTILQGDAVKNLPGEGTVFFLFNPFDDKIMRRFCDKVANLYAIKSHEIKIVYYNCEYLSVFETDSRFIVEELWDATSKRHRFALIALKSSEPEKSII